MTFDFTTLTKEDNYNCISNYGIMSMTGSNMGSPISAVDNKRLFNSNRRKSDIQDSYVLTKPPSKNTPSQHNPTLFRAMICGDSGIGKSALAHALAETPITAIDHLDHSQTMYEPIEVKNEDSNMFMIDTVGYGSSLQADIIFNQSRAYLEKQFEKTDNLFNPHYTDDDGYLSQIVYYSADTLTHVDVCLYLIMGRLKHVDIEYMRVIHELVNIIPVVMQLETSARPEVIEEQREAIIDVLKNNHIHYATLDNTIPYFFNWSSPKKDVPPRNLNALKHMLCVKYSSELRMMTADKYMKWRQTVRNAHLHYSSSTCSSTSSTSTTIKITQYISQRRQTLEKEMLLEEVKLRKELETVNRKKKTEIILNELKNIAKEDDSFILFNQDREVMLQPTTVYLSPWMILTLILVLFIVYQNTHIFHT